MCHCGSGKGDLSECFSSAAVEEPAVSSNIKASEERLTQSSYARTLRRLAQSGVQDMLGGMDRQELILLVQSSSAVKDDRRSGDEGGQCWEAPAEGPAADADGSTSGPGAGRRSPRQDTHTGATTDGSSAPAPKHASTLGFGGEDADGSERCITFSSSDHGDEGGGFGGGGGSGNFGFDVDGSKDGFVGSGGGGGNGPVDQPLSTTLGGAPGGRRRGRLRSPSRAGGCSGGGGAVTTAA